jgi:hypothetical protein
VVGLILVFLGTSVLPGISGDSTTTKWFTGFQGSTTVVMEKNHTMLVTISPTTSYAGDATMYDINVSLLGGGHPVASGLTVALYNATGVLVTGEDAWSKVGHYSIIDEEIILSGGTFSLYAYNDTDDSQGHNATLLVTKYTIATSPSVLLWKIDTDTTMTFQLTPPGNGTLELFNMSSALEAAIVGQSIPITIEDGVGTLNGVNATTIGNITFGYTPDGGEERSANGSVQIRPAINTTVFFAGLITDLHDTAGEIISFKAKLVVYAIVNPFEMGIVIPKEEIVIFRDHQGYIGPKFIFGKFIMLV